MKRQKFSLLVLCFLLLCFYAVLQPIQQLNNFENGFSTNYEEVQDLNKNKALGSFVSAKFAQREKDVSMQKQSEGVITFKLFGFIPVKRVVCSILDNDDYYVGGTPIGLLLNTDGAVVVDVEKESHAKQIKEGDIITQIDGEDVESLDEMPQMIQQKDRVEIEFLRNNKTRKEIVKTYPDETEDKLKLGLWVKDDVAGVGTLSFVNSKTMKYGALGHPIVDTTSGNVVPVSSGKIYPCNLVGIKRGKKNQPGELRCVFTENVGSVGDIKDNSQFGINGTLTKLDGLVDGNRMAKLGGRLCVKPGKAKIVSNISGIAEEYEIEIIKANYQKKAKNKSIVFRVKDKKLINLSGGIVQGMSGSPIIQDGKIVGAVTHVFTNDPTKGYGVYVDWML